MLNSVFSKSRSQSGTPTWWVRQASTIVALVSLIPRKPGIVLRNWLYRPLFAQLGRGVRIQSGVEFVQPQQIEIGDRVTINRGSYLSSAGTSKAEAGNNQVCLEAGVNLGFDVQLNTFGSNSRICLRQQVILDRGVDLRSLDRGSIEIGSATYIGPYTCLAGPGAIAIGKSCLIASHTGIYANNHNFADPSRQIVEQGITCKGIAIEDDCWLGTGVKVLDGVTIGRGSIIGAGAVVTKNIPPYSVAVGVPAKVVSRRESRLISNY